MDERNSADGEGGVVILLFLLALLFFASGQPPATGTDCPGGYWEAGVRYVDVALWVCP